MKKNSKTPQLPAAKAVAVHNTSAVANPQQLVDQYQVVIAAEKTCFRERVKFGAMLIQWERHLGEARGSHGEKDGLKGWLAENCPELSYATAMEYKVYAEKVLAIVQHMDALAMKRLSPDRYTPGYFLHRFPMRGISC